MCNGHNHSSWCTCGFGGEGHLGRSYGQSSSISAACRTVWQYRDENFCSPTACPYCGAKVFFVRHNGGSVWFDDLGSPWPKHPCFDDDRYGTQLRQTLAGDHQESRAALFGIVVETVATRPGVGGRIIVKCSDGSLIDEEFNTSRSLASLVGLLTVVLRDEQGHTSLKFVEPPATPQPQWASILEFAKKPGFPGNAQGRTVSLNDLIGQVVEVIGGGRKFRFRVDSTGEVKTFLTSFFLKKAQTSTRGTEAVLNPVRAPLGRKELPPVTPIPRLVTCESLDDDDEEFNEDTGYSPAALARIWKKMCDQWMS
jgi:hypothetical protein